MDSLSARGEKINLAADLGARWVCYTALWCYSGWVRHSIQLLGWFSNSELSFLIDRRVLLYPLFLVLSPHRHWPSVTMHLKHFAWWEAQLHRLRVVVQVVPKQENLGERGTVEWLLLLSAGLAWSLPSSLRYYQWLLWRRAVYVSLIWFYSKNNLWLSNLVFMPG